MQTEKRARVVAWNEQRTIEPCEREEAAARDCEKRPDEPCLQEHGPESDLQEIERHERIGRAAAEKELYGQRGHIQDERQEQFGIRYLGCETVADQTADIERHQEDEHRDHRRKRQRDAEPELNEEDGDDLAAYGQPPEMDEQQQVFLAGRIENGNRRFLVGRSSRAARTAPPCALTCPPYR